MKGCDAVSQPNILLLITDQQRYPRHWPDDPSFMRDLTPNDAELARTGLSFRHGFSNTSMCSPSRATLFTGLYPAQHGVTLTHTSEGLKPDPENAPHVVRNLADLLRKPGAPRERLLKGFGRGILRTGPEVRATSPSCPPRYPNLATVLRSAGYEVQYRGKWHLTHPGGGEWSDADSERLEREYGFAGWVPPDAGENAEAENFGGGNAGPLGGRLGRDLHAPGRGVPRRRGPARAVLPRRLAGQPARRPGLPGVVRARRLRRSASSATTASSCRPRSTRTCAASPASTRSCRWG